MNIQLQKSTIIKQIERIDDSDLVIPKWHKKIVRERKKNAISTVYKNWNILQIQLYKKYGVK